MGHIPVLLNEVLEILNPKPGQTFIDLTINGGGHAKEIAGRIGDEGMVAGIDWDCGQIEDLKKKTKEEGITNLTLICDNYANLKRICAEYSLGAPDGILADLGFSSNQLEGVARGFSFLKDEALDMRYSANSGLSSAADVVNGFSRMDLERIIKDYGEDRFAKRIAEAIVDSRKKKRIETTGELSRIISGAVSRREKIHPATRVFQALRIFVNRELENIKTMIPQAIEMVHSGGVIVIISFHSLEDRIVKNDFREAQKAGIVAILTKKPIMATREEIKINSRSRSAKLRAVKKI